MRRRTLKWSVGMGCLAVTAGLVVLLVAAAIGTAFVPIVVTECFSPTEAGLHRSWTCRYPYATETLSLQPAGVCAQSIAFDSGRVIKNLGRWSFDPIRGDVNLTGVTVVDNGFGAPASNLGPTSGLGIMSVRRSVTGSLYVVVNEAVELYFK